MVLSGGHNLRQIPGGQQWVGETFALWGWVGEGEVEEINRSGEDQRLQRGGSWSGRLWSLVCRGKEFGVFLADEGRCSWVSTQASQRKQWHPTPILLPGKFHGRRSLVGCSPWGCKESDTTERLHFHFSLFTFMHWRRKWQPTPVFLPGESQGRGSLVGCRLWGHTELDTTEVT